jgi:hypothetical protein
MDSNNPRLPKADPKGAGREPGKSEAEPRQKDTDGAPLVYNIVRFEQIERLGPKSWRTA